MVIGEDFEKIQWHPFGFDFVEPNAFIGDTLIFLIGLYLAFRVGKLRQNDAFITNWKRFLIVFSVGFFLGGLGHLLFNYLGLPGKYPSWYSGVVSVYFIEQAMISIMKNLVWRKRLLLWSKIKLALAIIATTLVLIFVDLSVDPSKGLRITTINSTIGLLFSLGFLSFYYRKTLNISFHYFWISILVMLPTAFFQTMKINFHPWFDRNDASHVLIIIALVLYYLGIKNYWRLTRNR